MQIRIFNRQDDKGLRALVERVNKLSLSLDSTDSDLRNVEATYFSGGGIFLVAEEDGEVKGYMGARPLTGETASSEPVANREILSITRQGVAPDLGQKEGRDLLDSMLKVVLNQAYQMDFASVEVPDLAKKSG